MANPDRKNSAQPPERIWLFGLLLIIVTAVAYLPAWNGKPIWDDAAHITQPHLRSGHGLVEIWSRLGATQQYYPLVHTAFWIEQNCGAIRFTVITLLTFWFTSSARLFCSKFWCG